MAGFNHNDRGKPTVWTDAGGGCQRAKVESVKDHEVTQTHKEAANLQMNQSDMKEAVKTAILQHDHVLLNLTSIILSMAKNHDSSTTYRFSMSSILRVCPSLKNLRSTILECNRSEVCLKSKGRTSRKVVIAILRCFQTQLCPSMRCTRSWCGSVAGEGGESLMRTCMK